MSIKSNGRKTEIETNGVSITYQDGYYDASTPIAKITHSSNGIRQSGSSRNVEISGNSQQCYAGRGITSEYNIKMVGSPEMFTGKDQMAADNCLNDLRGLLLQPGDNRNDASLASLPTIDFQAVTSSMTSSMTQQFTPQVPQLTRLQDLPQYAGYLKTWLQSVSITNAAYQAGCAARLEIERQLMQKYQSIKSLTKKFGQADFETILGGEIGLPSAEDIPNKEYNITRSRIYENYIPNLQSLLAAENNIS